MPFYLNATTPPPQPHTFDYMKAATLQLTVEPATHFGWHTIKNYGPFETIEAAEAEVSRLMPNGWRHLFLEDHKYANLPDAIRNYTDVPARKASARDLSTVFAFTLSGLRSSHASALEIGREGQGMYEQFWNAGLDLGMGMTTYLCELAASVMPTGNSLQFLEDAARSAAVAAIDDRQMRAAMLNASLTPRPKGKRGGARDQLLWDIRDVLNVAGIIVVYLNDNPASMLVFTRPEGM